MRPAAAAIGAATLLLGGILCAAPETGHPRVVLHVDACGDLDQAEVRRITSVELGALLVDEPAAGDATVDARDTTRVRARCQGEIIALRIDDPITRKSLERSIDLSAQPPRARARLLALAVAEAVTASWTELEVNPAPKVAPMGPPPSPAATRAAREAVRAIVREEAPPPPRPLRILGALTTRTYPTHTSLLVGASVRFAQDRDLLAWSLDASADHGSRAYAQGHIDTTTIAIAPALMIHRTLAPLVIRGGVGVRGGVALHVGSSPADGVSPATVAGPFLGPMGLVSMSTALAAPAVLELTLEGGYVVLPVGALVDGARVVAIDGAWVGASLGIGFFP